MKKIKRMTLMEKTTRSMENKLDKYEETYEKLKVLLGGDFLESEKYRAFLAKMERNKELKREIMVKEDKVRFLRGTMENKKKALEVKISTFLIFAVTFIF